MSQQKSGLRFDIYERVHLPEDGAGIGELTSIELTPEISVEQLGDQAVLRGHLFLSGTYSSTGETRGEEQLTHRIPVEITLPMNRIQSVEDISVEIENFDVDALSARSLNVTGVLSLNGIEMVPVEAVDWREEDEVVFTHRAEEEPSATASETEESAVFAFEAVPNVAEDARVSDAEAEQEAVQFAFEAVPNVAEDVRDSEIEAKEEAVRFAFEAVPNVEVDVRDSEIEAEAQPFLAETEQEPVVFAAASAVPMAEERNDIKIALSGKSEEERRDTFGGLGALIAAASSDSFREEPVAVEAAVQPALPQDSEGKDRLEWKKLFLSNAPDAPQFRRVRMCIAQKTDTIETIAERYKKSVRELMLYNRLNDQYLQEGQVVYIP